MTPLELATDRMNQLGKERVPFLFVFDYLMRQPIVLPISMIKPTEILFALNGQHNMPEALVPDRNKICFDIDPPEIKRFEQAFNKVMHHLRRGDSYLLNLTMPVTITTNLNLKEIFYLSQAKYKLWINNLFTVFSPEPFVKIDNGRIFSFPMKGTIDATLPDAAALLIENPKEIAEHYTIVDLIRNDLNMVAEGIKVERFRYLEEIITSKGKLSQTSSLISGHLPENYHETIGNILTRLLPAGSITGAPKKRTVEIIHEAEQYDRNYYSGVFGLFDGQNLDSGVMIRFIEQTPDGLLFKAGGGITINSIMDEEYNELVNKVYLPIR
ncbi:MAG: aminodeoxychorismate synthase component I [Bacteroidales bacterium]|nr:aminodeoxychorismate synthase component I [Bacteroidales bacterium]